MFFFKWVTIPCEFQLLSHLKKIWVPLGPLVDGSTIFSKVTKMQKYTSNILYVLQKYHNTCHIAVLSIDFYTQNEHYSGWAGIKWQEYQCVWSTMTSYGSRMRKWRFVPLYVTESPHTHTHTHFPPFRRVIHLDFTICTNVVPTPQEQCPCISIALNANTEALSVDKIEKQYCSKEPRGQLQFCATVNPCLPSAQPSVPSQAFSTVQQPWQVTSI